VIYRYHKNIAVLRVTVLYTVGLLNTAVYRSAVLVMAALCNTASHYIIALWFLLLLSSSFFSSPNLSHRTLDVYRTSTHDIALVHI